MNIGDVSKLSGLPIKTIRYYEEIGLVEPARSDNGYRNYHDNDYHKLAFLARARALGFTIEDCRNLLQLYENKARSSSEVKAIALQHLEQIKKKTADLQEMEKTLSTLVNACAGDDRPECPILESLSGPDLNQQAE